CYVQVGSINRPIFARGSSDTNRVALLLDLYDSPQWTWFGRAMQSGSVALCSGGSEMMITTAAATRWGFVSADRDQLDPFAPTFRGRDLPRPRRGPASITAGPGELAMLRDLLINSFSACQAGRPRRMPLGSSLDRTLCRLMVEILLGETGGVRAEAAR